MLPTLVDKPPAGDKWLHEIKHDGFRTQLVFDGSQRRAFTRNGFDWSECYRFVLEDAARLGCSSAVIDGEIIVQDEQGRADFDALKLALNRSPEKLIFYAFDLLHLDGRDLRNGTVVDRRQRLHELVGEHDPTSRIQFSEHVIGGGPEFFDVACSAELEGIVSKKLASRYCSGRSTAWRKTKAFVEGEFVVIGHKRDKDRSVALLARETAEGLEYAGSAFVTLSDAQRELFWRSVERLTTDGPAAPAGSLSGASWVKPEMRVTAKHLRCSGKLRHATLRGLELAPPNRPTTS
jgi:bifunctional non-homologous end joining protein LigD